MPEFDPRSYAYPSRRNVVYARKAMACTSIPQGAQIGLDVMKAGGNAVDAAVAMAAAMPLLEPTSNGLGSDCFALVWVEAEKKLYGLNASGVAPAALSAALVRELGHQTMPRGRLDTHHGARRSGGWAELNRRFGTKPLPQLFTPAISGRPGRRSRPGEPGAHVGGGRPADRRRHGAGPLPPRLLVGAVYEAGRHALPGGGRLSLGGVRSDPGGAGGHRLRELLPRSSDGADRGLQPGHRRLLL